MPCFEISFDLSSFKELDHLALLATQGYNLGSTGDWFGEFRGGLYGFYARVYGVQRHYNEVHAWLPHFRSMTETEYHLSTILFQMDSALECLAFALNALGWIVFSVDFRDVTDAKALKRISPLDILGDATKIPPISPLAGYKKVFPATQTAWQNESPLIAQIRDLHDVSKHRKTIFEGGEARSDPPEGFFEALGTTDDPTRCALLRPMSEVILKADPKLPAIHRTPSAVHQGELLEVLVPSFAKLIKTTGEAALADAQATVPLKEKQFRI